MSERALFEDFPVDTRKFYSQIVYFSMLNLAAVKQGLFDVNLCDIENDGLCLYNWFRFCEQIPVLRVQLGLTMPEVDTDGH